MRVVFGSDHAGFVLKNLLLAWVRDELGYEILDVGTDSEASCDYPQYAVLASEAILSGRADLGVLICGTGIGISVAANKVPGIIAARCCESYSARMAREHNGAQIVCLGARVVGDELAKEIVDSFLKATVDPGTNHTRRREQLKALDAAK